ncbi:uncharacterized protein LOC122497661 [Leptopilina heterotoma]|uniref:uncharacterized protein LOC122497661 n=1 Tax=Leptopilina heterotoma TaxID=63436 RepID=UPI001CA7C321|nr:uncharacterized protein LOC122497661 [Leptopilina heterotoma]
MSRRGILRGKAALRHQPMEEFQPPRNLSEPPSILDFPIHDSGKRRPLNMTHQRAGTDLGKGDVNEISTIDVVDPISLPKAERAETILRRKENENWAEFGSRLAVEELDRFVKSLDPKTSVTIEKLKEHQSIELNARKHVITKEDLVSLNDDDIDEARAITPPGPPTRTITGNPNLTIEAGNSRDTLLTVTREALPRKTTGVMFDDIESIPTDPTVDPPPRVCQNCWRKGHYRAKCPKEVTEASCENCGRKFETVATCPRCAAGYRRFLLRGKKGNKKNLQITRGESKVEDIDNVPERQSREGNPLLPPIWTREVNLGVNVGGYGNNYRTWQIPKTPSPAISRNPSTESLFDENMTATPVKILDNNIGSGKLPIFDEGDSSEPPAYSEVEPRKEQPSDLITAIREITMVMEGLPVETINMAIRQLIREREKKLDKD